MFLVTMGYLYIHLRYQVTSYMLPRGRMDKVHSMDGAKKNNQLHYEKFTTI